MKRFFNNRRMAGLLSIILLLSFIITGCTSSDVETAIDIVEAVVESQITSETEVTVKPSDTEKPDNAEQAQNIDKPQSTEQPQATDTSQNVEVSSQIDEDSAYTDKDSVALYIHTYGHLPPNYITKQEATAAGWKDKGTLDKLCPGKSIGGDKFGNYEGLLPKAKGRQYYECDIDYKKGNRNSKRIIYSNDGLIYYTSDHYNTFTQLY